MMLETDMNLCVTAGFSRKTFLNPKLRKMDQKLIEMVIYIQM